MSEFDWDAERERLRKQYERDKEKRAATERMSELLLQGATMTNAHCTECGDPIFRSDGQEFCATCERPVVRQEADDADETDDDSSTTVEVTSPSDESRVVFGDQSAENVAEEGADIEEPTTGETGDGDSSHTAAHRSGEAEQTEQSASRGAETDGQDQGARRGGETAGPAQPTHSTTASDQHVKDEVAVGSGSLEPARTSLTQTLVRYSQRAEQTDDPRQAREYLRTAREAAETLAALER